MLTVNEAARRLGVIPRRVRQLIRSGQLPAEKVGRDWLIEESAVANYAPRPVGRPKVYPLEDEGEV